MCHLQQSNAEVNASVVPWLSCYAMSSLVLLLVSDSLCRDMQLLVQHPSHTTCVVSSVKL